MATPPHAPRAAAGHLHPSLHRFARAEGLRLVPAGHGAHGDTAGAHGQALSARAVVDPGGPVVGPMAWDGSMAGMAGIWLGSDGWL